MTAKYDMRLGFGHDSFILRYRVGEWRVAKAFRSREEREAFREHIIRVYNARIIK